jgi:hypothetical protein
LLKNDYVANQLALQPSPSKGEQEHAHRDIPCIVLADAGHGVDTAFRGSAWFRRIMELKLGAQALEQAYRRMVFNIVGRFVSPAQAMPL